MPKQEQEVVLRIIRDVYFYYSQLKDPVLTKAAKDKGIKQDPDNPSKNSEYTLKIAMPYEDFRNLKKQKWVPNGGVFSNFPKAKEFSISEFEKTFHKDGGMPDFGDAEEVVLIKFSQKAMNASGREMQAPKVLGIKGKVQDHEGKTVNQDVLLGNGTKGHLQVRPVEFKDYDPYLYPHKVIITNLVEYTGGCGLDDSVGEDDIGFEELTEEDLENIENGVDDEYDDEYDEEYDES